MRLAFSAVFVSVLLAAAPALADEHCNLAVNHTLGFGFLLPEPDCPATLHGDVGVGVGRAFRGAQESDAQSPTTEPLDVRIYAEAGVLFKLEDTIDVGPVLGLSGYGHDHGDDEGVQFEDTELTGLVRTRVWGPEGLIALDLAIGPGLYLKNGSELLGPTTHFEVGPRLLRVLGLFVSYDHVFGDVQEDRVMGGATVTMGGAVLGLCLAAGC